MCFFRYQAADNPLQQSLKDFALLFFWHQFSVWWKRFLPDIYQSSVGPCSQIGSIPWFPLLPHTHGSEDNGRGGYFEGDFLWQLAEGGHLFLAHKNDKKPANHNFSAFRAKIRPKKYPTTFFEEGGTYLADWKKRPNRPFIRCTSGMSRAFIFGKFFRCFSHFQFLVLGADASGRGGRKLSVAYSGRGQTFFTFNSLHARGIFCCSNCVLSRYPIDTMYFRPFPELCNADFNDCNVPETPPVISNAGTPPEKIVAS